MSLSRTRPKSGVAHRPTDSNYSAGTTHGASPGCQQTFPKQTKSFDGVLPPCASPSFNGRSVRPGRENTNEGLQKERNLGLAVATLPPAVRMSNYRYKNPLSPPPSELNNINICSKCTRNAIQMQKKKFFLMYCLIRRATAAI